MYPVAIAWIYVVLMAALIEATSAGGTAVGAVFTVLLWGVLPLGIVLYLMGAAARRRSARSARRDPDRGGHAAGDAVAPEREEP
jgi:hypothetical protein